MRKKKKIIQVPIDDDLLARLDAVAYEIHEPRAALIREACAQYLSGRQKLELDRQYIEGYMKFPESPAMGEAGLVLASQVLEPEDWSDAEG